jgi:hypothetical protein
MGPCGIFPVSFDGHHSVWMFGGSAYSHRRRLREYGFTHPVVHLFLISCTTTQVLMGMGWGQRAPAVLVLLRSHRDSEHPYVLFFLLQPGLTNVPPPQCYLWPPGSKRPSLKHDAPLAQFCGHPVTHRAGDARTYSPITLSVKPDGHVGPRLDYIVLSALILERRRLFRLYDSWRS